MFFGTTRAHHGEHCAGRSLRQQQSGAAGRTVAGAGSPAPSPAPAPGQTVAAVSIPTNAATLGNRAFNPGELNVTAGTTVTWTNTDTVTHTSSSDAQGWDSGAIAPGGQFSFAFPAAGTFPYHCAIHPGMVGRVVVR